MASDHIPFSVVLNPGNLPLLMSDDESIRIGKIDWPKLSKDDLDKYVCRFDVLLSNIILPKDAILCRDLNCKNVQCCKALCSLYVCMN